MRMKLGHRARRLGRALLVLAAILLAPAGMAWTGTARAAPAEVSQEAGKDWTGRALDPATGPFAAGFRVYGEHCAACHDAGSSRAPQRLVIQDMTPRAIHRALSDGAMREQGALLTADQRTAVAEYLANRTIAQDTATSSHHRCEGRRAAFDWNEPPAFANWGLDPASTHGIPTKIAGLTRRSAPRLKLKWAFGFPDASRMRSQPTVAGGAIILGNHTGTVFALDRETGCVRWTFEAEAEVRSGVIAAPWRAGDRGAKPLIHFGDLIGNVYGVEAATGKLAWKITADTHPSTVITGTPALHAGTLYVPVSSIEEASAAAPGYACCNFRGSILALDAATGQEKWRTYLVGEARVTGTGKDGVEQLGPSGVAVWNSPAIDAKRGQLYVATGDNYSAPATELSDSVLAIDLATGRIRWHYQALAGDAWNVACHMQDNDNCPDDAGPDYDFGAGTVLAKGTDGRELVLAGQKSSIVYAIDPDSGKLVWQTRLGRGSISGGVLFGMASSAGRLFVPIMDQIDEKTSSHPPAPGVHAVDIASGKVLWHAPLPDTCAGRKLCAPGLDGAITATPELVLAGAADGHLRVHDALTGKVLRDIDMVQPFPTVNGVPARGGAIGGSAAPIAYKGSLIAVSGYGFASKMPGNVLLVFGAE